MKPLRRMLFSEPEDPGGWRKERHDLFAGVAGGALVGMPLLYTMEMWTRGATLSPWHQLLILAATLAINFVFCLMSGFRPERGLLEAAIESVTAVGIGVVFAFIVLVLIGEIEPGAGLAEMSGKLLLEGAAVSMGVSFADAHLRGKSRVEGGEGVQDEPPAPGDPPGGASGDAESLQLREDLLDLAATLIGSVLFTLNIAPTEEVVRIASQLNAWQLLAMLVATLALCYVILYASGFEDQPVHVEGLLQSPWAETVIAVGTSLLVSAGLLTVIGRPEAMGSVASGVASVVVLGLPAAVGGAAGRLVT